MNTMTKYFFRILIYLKYVNEERESLKSKEEFR